VTVIALMTVAIGAGLTTQMTSPWRRSRHGSS
jgi:hypothetical protein